MPFPSAMPTAPLPPFLRADDSSVHAAFADGRPAVLLDEHGAVLAMPAQTATVEAVQFAIRNSSGLLHAAAPSALLDRLRILDQPVLDSEDSGASFTVSVDASTDITTGISARDRTRTLRALAGPDTSPHDLTRPGHVLPIRCADGGFEVRPRVWELAVDLVTAAGHRPVAVVCRLVDDNGETLDDASGSRFARRHGLPCIGLRD